MIGRIIKCISNDYTVLCNDKKYICKARGRFRKVGLTPLVGDIVKINPKEFYIVEILPRKNVLVRPPICNIDQVIIITSVKKPKFSSQLLDKLLMIAEYNNINPILIFTKIDLLDQKKGISLYMDYYKNIGYEVYENTDLENIKRIFKDKISVFTGQSGVGKSTLLNHLDMNLHLKTNDISEALGRGKHTTRHIELLRLLGGMIADTPGFSSLDLNFLDAISIRDNFKDFNIYRDMCKYKDCLHDQEDGCIIKQKVEEGLILKSRYENYLKYIHDYKVQRKEY